MDSPLPSSDPSRESGPAPSSPSGSLALAMGGGGARAAYQVGFLRFLARRYPDLDIPYLTGVSAGAINAAHLAGHQGSFADAVRELSTLWSGLTVDEVFRVDPWSLARNILGWGAQLVSGGMGGPVRVRGLVDTRPLRKLLTEVFHAVDGKIVGIEANLRRGRLRAVALSTSSYTTGQSITWVQGKEIEEWERPQRRSRNTVLSVDHVMASTALPLFFPAVQLGGHWYGDGGIRLTAPLSPALHLGARKVLAISTRYSRTQVEADRPLLTGYPPPAQVLGVLLNSIFLDLLDQDAHRLERLNRVVSKLPPDEREGLKTIDHKILRPSRDLGVLANEYEPRLPRSFRFLSRGLGTRETESPDALSLILFQGDYLSRLMDLGEADAEARAEELEAFIED